MTALRTLMDLTGRVALVAGGAGHIGRAAASALAELGADIVIVDRDAEATAEAAAAVGRDFPVRALGLAVDMADDGRLRAIPAEIEDRLGRLDILVHTAALVSATPIAGYAVPFAEQSAAAWRQALEINLTSLFVLAQASAELLTRSGHGSIVALGSIYGLVGPDLGLYADTGMGNPAAYAASKGGVLQLTRWLATALAPDIRVNAISPGGVFRHQDPRFVERYVAKTPLGRMATEADLIGAIAYLASDLSSYVTGQNLVVDGGWTAW